MMTRRHFLTFLGIGSYELLRSNSLLAVTSGASKKKGQPFFQPITASEEDVLKLPLGYKYSLVVTHGDPLGSHGPFGAEAFGSDNDFNCFFPLKGKSDEGILWSNHEYVHPVFASGVLSAADKTLEQIQNEKLMVGGSLTHLKRGTKGWKYIQDPTTNQRFTARYPEIEVTGPVAAVIKNGLGTLANCSGGKTPWNTVLTCEENFQMFNPVGDSQLGWGKFSETAIDERQYGWVVEIDPFKKLKPKKHSSLGRFSHENASLTVGQKGHLVVYMGDDANDQCFYKFVSAEKMGSKKTQSEKSSLLERGTLYVADFQNKKWLSLDIEKNPKLKEAGFKSQAEVLLETRKAAKTAGGSPMDRPEDCEIHKDGSVYIAFTNNKNRGNYFGQIVRLIEKNSDAEALEFQFEIFLAGGPDSGLAAPDNLMFDSKGNLWVCCDVSAGELNQGKYAAFKNNGMFFVPTSGADKGTAYQFASAPIEAELTGLCFTDQEDTMFLSVQHPGEKSRDMKNPTSHWPSGVGLPKSSVVAIEGFK